MTSPSRGHPRSRRSCGRVLATIVLVLWTAGCGSTEGPARLTLGVAAPSGGQAGLLAARDAGLFAAEGLDIDLVVFPSTGEGAMAMVTSEIEICSGIGSPFLNAVLAGAPLVAVAELLGKIPSSLVGAPGVTTVAGLAGQRIGIPRLGSNGHIATRLALRRLGLDPDRDVTLVPAGNTPARLVAVGRGDVQAVLLSPPAITLARQMGLAEILDLRSLDLDYMFEPLVVRRELLDEQPEVIDKVIRAAVAGARYFKAHPEEGKAILGRLLQVDDETALADAYAYFAETIKERPSLSEAAIASVIAEIATTDPAARALQPRDVLDGRFIDALDAEGFFLEESRVPPGVRP